jgi:hypothetical protein
MEPLSKKQEKYQGYIYVKNKWKRRKRDNHSKGNSSYH